MADESTEAVQATETPAAGTEEMVSKERMDEVVAENKALKEKNELIEQNSALIQANSAAPAKQAEQFDIFKEVGLNPDDPKDIPDQAQLKKINAYNQQQNQVILNQIQFKIDHPDYSQIVGTAAQIRTGNFAAPLKQAIKENPALMATIQNSRDPMAAAYAIGKQQEKKAAAGDKTTTTKTEAEAAINEAVENAKTVKTSANAKGGDGLSEEGRTANMTDADFIKQYNASGGDL